MDAGFPLLYIETFEELKADNLIALAAKNQNYSVIEYNANGLFHETNESKPDNNNLGEILKNFIKSNAMAVKNFNLERKVLVLKDMTKNLEDPIIVGRLKYIAKKISLPSSQLCRKLTESFKGMPEFEIKNVLALAVTKDGRTCSGRFNTHSRAEKTDNSKVGHTGND